MSSTDLPLKKLTPEQRREILRKCESKFNWSDGGQWIGRGVAPKCLQKDRLMNRLSHTLHFASDETATKWNVECEKAIRYGGHLGTAALTVGVAVATGGVITPIVIGFVAAVAKDELQAKIPYPRMARGWCYEVIFENEFIWSPHPWGQKSFFQRVITVSRDWEKKEVYRSSSDIKYRIDELPDGVARTIAAAPSRKTESIYA